jgi:hypothetical protein
MGNQSALRLSVSRADGTTNRLRFDTSPVPESKLLADMLKRLAKRVMRAVNDCPPDTIASNIERLIDLEEVCRFVINHKLVSEADCRLSGFQLQHPSSLMDFVACLDITRQQHRCPEFIHPENEAQKRIEAKLDLIAGELARMNGGAL